MADPESVGDGQGPNGEIKEAVENIAVSNIKDYKYRINEIMSAITEMRRHMAAASSNIGTVMDTADVLGLNGCVGMSSKTAQLSMKLNECGNTAGSLVHDTERMLNQMAVKGIEGHGR